LVLQHPECGVQILIDTSKGVDFWIVIGLSSESQEQIVDLNPALWDRITNKGNYAITLFPLSADYALRLVKWWLRTVRPKNTVPPSDLFPFDEKLLDFLKSMVPTKMFPRALVRLFFSLFQKQLIKRESRLSQLNLLKRYLTSTTILSQ
jgi:hypothetical protein